MEKSVDSECFGLSNLSFYHRLTCFLLIYCHLHFIHNFSVLCYQAGSFYSEYIYFHCLQTLKLNCENRKTKKNRIWLVDNFVLPNDLSTIKLGYKDHGYNELMG